MKQFPTIMRLRGFGVEELTLFSLTEELEHSCDFNRIQIFNKGMFLI